jgi:hypothetical protein
MNMKEKCKIWLGGFSDSEQLTYSTSFNSVDEDNSYNDWLTVSRDDLTWDAGGFSRLGGGESSGLTHRRAARYLWTQFVEPLKAEPLKRE